MNHLNKKRKLVIIGLICFISMLFLLSRTDQREDFILIEGKMNELVGPWNVSVNEVVESNVKLPYDFKLKPGILYSASVVIPFLAEKQDTLLIRSSMQDVWVYIDNKLIYEHVQLEPLDLHMPPASLWVLVDIPENSTGQTLRIDYKTNVSSFSGVINKVYLDRKAMVLHDLFFSQSFSFAIFLTLFLLGIIVIGTSFAFENYQDLRLLYLGFMALSSGLWILTESRLLQFFIGSRFILGSIAYLMIPITAFFFVLYVKDAIITQTKYKNHLRYLAITFVAIVLINVLLQITGVLVYIEMMDYTLPIILISAIYLAYLIYLEVNVYHNNEAKRFVKFTIILLISLMLEIGSFFFHAFNSISSFFRIGIVLFFAMLVLDTFVYVRTNMRRKDETLLLEKMAYKDYLTGGFNRSAYERDVQKYLDTVKEFRLILLDLNDLKYINDTFGHSQGDEAIRLVFKAMEESFVSGQNYRIGGDEFAVLLDDIDEELFQEYAKIFQDTLMHTTVNFVYRIHVALGSDVYDFDLWDYYGKFYHHVDQKMYENKLEIKSASDVLR